MTEEQIKHMVQRFLSWKLPHSFRPDAGISFEPLFNIEYMASQDKPPMRHEPTGTNLFDATQAEAMVRHMLDGMPLA
jgi:hypothetical protein